MRESNTKGSDIFSLGLVVFFVATSGGHALGGPRERTSNLMRLKFTGSSEHVNQYLVRAGPEAADLVGAMLAAESRNRPSADAVLAHPLFWTLGEKVRYIDRIHRTCSSDEALKACVDGADWGGGDWRLLQEVLPDRLWQRSKPGCFVFADDSTSQYGSRASELVRLIRNLSQHFTEQRVELQQAILERGGVGAAAEGSVLTVDEQEEAVGRCFFGAFPSLIVHLRRAAAQAAQAAQAARREQAAGATR